MQETQETQVPSLGWKDTLEEEMATHSSILPGKFHGQRDLAGCSTPGQKESATECAHSLHCPWASLVAQTVKNACNAGDRVNPQVGKIPWRREWLLIPVLFPGEFHGQRSLAGYNTWGHKESDTNEQLTLPTNDYCAPLFNFVTAVIDMSPR